jgi:hypothetical protein
MSTAVRPNIRSAVSQYHLGLGFFMIANALDWTELEIINNYLSPYKILS